MSTYLVVVVADSARVGLYYCFPMCMVPQCMVKLKLPTKLSVRSYWQTLFFPEMFSSLTYHVAGYFRGTKLPKLNISGFYFRGKPLQ